MAIPIIFAFAGFIYAFPVISGLTYVATHFMHIGTFSWTFVFVTSCFPASILGIKILDW